MFCPFRPANNNELPLARLLVSQARLWLLDEPFTTLDPAGVALLEQLIREHTKQGGAVLLTTHQPLDVPDLHSLRLGDASSGRAP